MDLFGTEYFVFVTIFLQFFDAFHYFFCLYLKSLLYGVQRLISKLLDGENDLHHESEAVNFNKMSFHWVVFFEAFAVNSIGLRGFWLKIISYGNGPNTFVI